MKPTKVSKCKSKSQDDYGLKGQSFQVKSDTDAGSQVCWNPIQAIHLIGVVSIEGMLLVEELVFIPLKSRKIKEETL